MDLLGSIMGSMEKPPTASEREKKMAKAIKDKQEKLEADEKAKRDEFKEKIGKLIGEFLADQEKRKHSFEPNNKVYRSILHEAAEAAGVLSFSITTDADDEKRVVIFKKEFPPSDEELQALRRGEEYDPSKHVAAAASLASRAPPPPEQHQTGQRHYQEKYRHLLGGLECAQQSAVKMEPKKTFGYVPSANKRDLRSIEETLNDMRERKKPRLDHDPREDKDSQAEISSPNIRTSNSTAT